MLMGSLPAPPAHAAVPSVLHLSKISIGARAGARSAHPNNKNRPSQALQISELLALDRPVRMCPLSDRSRPMKWGEGASAPGQEWPLASVCLRGA